MHVWALAALVIEAMALVGVLGILITRRTHIAFAVGFNTMVVVAALYIFTAPPVRARHLIMLAMVLLYAAHMNWLLLFKSRQTAIGKIDTRLPPAQKLLMAVLLTNAVGWAYCLPFYFGARRTAPLSLMDGLAVLVYIVGTVIHFGSDYQKQRFKGRPGTKGKLLTTGFWGLCRHPNYFGDFLIYIAFALIGGSLWGWIAPLVNFLQYRFDAIPKNERWAAEHYGAQWEAYRKRVRMFIPFLY